ncbi:conserved Plasmodium protein, unknown function [Plasmodium berghei]|uniref:Uncharacterized protein n=2 Tax=Plasmodium berghei TaxID=5821 RepID=A0A509AHZ4_PLABA|nr:conserved Plasmodium protein, unknown function [Plasmodium berghei ANKA]CXI37181.1 conserved Plasmodium protein, unknown function [Plasmodium berghei]SCM21653.1 conserved Plasmodium protein, unknown function [Plasmodium berghei]SCN24852.1 conserved Plasmodium protein, unknown function [Plasmodium berghei]SCO59968.1 conserved Plasmodium protein, unknown function [Plasmodium berghei]SCO61351.1 conserved Plasmodium protein, unknown function [Plasmodium berghei]|eukprot:XP_034421328.1 conserved Plasmodium protein, unknown function [Plasmodium berghei ANKA]
MNNICTTIVVIKLLDFLPFLDDFFKLLYLNKTWRNAVLDVIKNTNLLRKKTIICLKNKKYILLILKYMNSNNNINNEITDCSSLVYPNKYILSPFSNVLKLIIESWNLSPLFINCIQIAFPKLIYFKIVISSPICIALLKNYCFNSKSLRYITICFANTELNNEYREKLTKSINNFLFRWNINVKLITE